MWRRASCPTANVVVAVLAAVIFRVLNLSAADSSFVMQTLFWIVSLNMLLAVFNLLPIPPLDGYNVALAFLPPRQAMFLMRYGQYGVFILLGLILLSYTNSPIDPLGWILALASELAFALIGA